MLPLQKVRFRFQQDKSCSLEVVLVDRTKKGTVHSLVTMAGNVATAACCLDLLHGEERKVWDDGGYHGQPEASIQAAAKAQDMTCKITGYKGLLDELRRPKRRSKSSVRAKLKIRSVS